MANFLDTWITIFQSDTSSVEKGNKQAKKSADDLIKTLKDTDAVAGKVGRSFKDMATDAAKGIAAALAVNAVVSGSIGKAQDIVQIQQTADALGVAVEELDAFGRAAVAAGGDAQGARDSVTDMAESIGEALQDVESGRAKTFAGLGISLRDLKGQAKDGITGLLDLAGAVEGMSRQEAIFRIKELGITDNRTVEMVLKGRKELERMLAVQKQQGVITKENAEEARRFTDALNQLRGSADNAGTGFMTAIIPALTIAVEWLTKIVNWAGEHSHVIVGFFAAVAAIVTAVYLPAMVSAAAATLAATWPLITMIATIVAVAAAFALAYDDIMNFIEGNDSFIGQIFESFPMVKTLVYGIIDAFKLMGDIVGAVFQSLWLGFQQLVNFVMIGVGKISEGLSAVKSFFGFGGGDAAMNVDAGQQAIAAANASPLNATTSGAISNTVASTNKETNMNVEQLIVQTQATDANGISAGIAGSLESELASMDQEFATGVAR